MKAQIRWIHSPDAELDEFEPENPRYVDVLLQLMIGEEGVDQGEDSFSVHVMTSERLADRVRQHGPHLGRHTLIIDQWDWPQIKALLTNLFENEEGADWDELAGRLGRYGHWEFEDFVDDEDEDAE